MSKRSQASGTVRPTAGSFCEPTSIPICGDEEALRDRLWEACLNRDESAALSSWRFLTTSFNEFSSRH